MRYTWSESKRRRNLKDHGLDFTDAPKVFAGVTYTFEDDRLDYPEQRLVTLGLLTGVPCPSFILKLPMKSASSRSAKRRVVKSRSISKQSDGVRESRVRVTAEHPEADVAHIARGIVRRGLKPIPPKESISLRIDPDVLAWF